MKKHKTSSRDKIEFECLKIWSCHTFKQPDLDTMLKVFTLHEQKKLIASVLMVIATIVRLFSKQWFAISIFTLFNELE